MSSVTGPAAGESGWSSRNSSSSPSARRGPGWSRSCEGSVTQRASFRPGSARSFSTPPWSGPAELITTSTRARITLSTEYTGYGVAARSAAFAPPASRSSSSAKEPGPATTSGSKS